MEKVDDATKAGQGKISQKGGSGPVEWNKDTTIEIQLVKKTKKNEPKIFPSLMLVDREAFQPCGQENTRFIMKEFWKSTNNKIIVARKQSTGAILGYAIFAASDTRDPRFGKNWIKSCYLLRIAVRMNSQGHGIGKKMVNYLLLNYPEHALSLDVSTDNTNAVEFYKKVGLKVQRLYLSEPDKCEFAQMETELDKQGSKIPSEYEINLTQSVMGPDDASVRRLQKLRASSPVQTYFQDFDQYKEHCSVLENETEPLDVAHKPTIPKIKNKRQDDDVVEAKHSNRSTPESGILTDLEQVLAPKSQGAEMDKTATEEITENQQPMGEKECADDLNENQQDGQDSTMSSQDMSASHRKEAKQQDGLPEEEELDAAEGQGDLGRLQC